MKTVCNSKSIEEMNAQLKPKGYNLGGLFNPQTQKITVYIDDRDNRIRKHETVHKWQSSQNRSFSCDQKWFMFLNEVQANIGSYLPDTSFRKKYGDF